MAATDLALVACSLPATTLSRKTAEFGSLTVCYDAAVAAADVLTEILRLPAEERARLALELLRSLDGEPDADASAAWDAEIERRGAEVDAGTAETLTLDEYRAHVRARRAARAGR